MLTYKQEIIEQLKTTENKMDNKNNTGKDNSGNRNSGNRNSGYRNSGDGNSGNRNSGYSNSGDGNSGNRNSGYRNSGYRNSGDRNSGYSNSGDGNSGNWNSCSHETGAFNTHQSEKVRIFNKEYDRDAWEKIHKPDCLYFELCKWVPEDKMSDQEKIDNKHFHVTQGYLKTLKYKEAFTASMKAASDEEIEQVKSLPNFDADIFLEISGYDVRTRNQVKVVANGKEVYISKDSAESLGLI